ncbi:MAG: PD40 domain-containing protein, partial [Chitinophagaceae bacterium]|nr:PD40 domain-containing protein [Anaerolineae bacterium]
MREVVRAASLLIVLCSAFISSALAAGRILPHAPQIAFVSAFNNSANLYLLDIRHGALRPLTQLPSLQRGPVWSNDGLRLVYESNAGNNNINLFMIDVRGGPSAERQLTYFSFDEVEALFMPNRGQTPEGFVFTTVRGPNGDIFMLDVPPVGENNRPEL